jgi:hypothetical protein
MLETGNIQRSKLPASVPIGCMQHAYGSDLHVCVDYIRINIITIANQYPVPIMTKLQDRIRRFKIFTKIDLKDGYHLIHINEGDEWIIPVSLQDSLYQFPVMPIQTYKGPSKLSRYDDAYFEIPARQW